MQKSDLIRIANYYVQNDISIADLAKMNGISKTTLIRLFKGNGTVYLPQNLQQQVDLKKSKNWIDGKTTYGNKGNISISKDKLISIANTIVGGDFTIREVASAFNLNPTTLYNLLNEENLGSELYGKLQKLYIEHSRSKKI